MSKAVDILSIALLVAAGVAFAVGVHALADTRDIAALYWLAIGALLLRGSTDMLRPGPNER